MVWTENPRTTREHRLLLNYTIQTWIHSQSGQRVARQDLRSNHSWQRLAKKASFAARSENYERPIANCPRGKNSQRSLIASVKGVANEARFVIVE